MSTIRDHVMVQPLFCSHDHHRTLAEFDAHRATYDHTSLLGYAHDDLATAAGSTADHAAEAADLARLWPPFASRFGAPSSWLPALFGLEYEPANFRPSPALQMQSRPHSVRGL
jgi:hypothetical protein